MELANSIKKRNYTNLNAVLVLPGDIPKNAAILIFLYVIYFSIKKTMVNFILIFLVYFITLTFLNLTESKESKEILFE